MASHYKDRTCFATQAALSSQSRILPGTKKRRRDAHSEPCNTSANNELSVANDWGSGRLTELSSVGWHDVVPAGTAVIARRTAASGARSLKETSPEVSTPSSFQSPARSY